MSYSENMSNSNLAFGSGEFATALKYAEAAIKEEPKETEAYYAAGKACMSMDQPDRAVEYFTTAVKIDNKNGNGYFLLGYASAMAGKMAEALKALTEALENDCDEMLKGQIYKIMAMINTDHGDFENALLNISQAEQYVGIDYELLRQKAGCYASLKNYRETLFTLNQMKLLQPNTYAAYSLAFHIFLDLDIYDEAKAELDRAAEFADLNMDYYNDRVAYAMMHHLTDNSPEALNRRWKDTLREIDTALRKGKPSAEQAYESYLRAAQLYLSLEQPDLTIRCLNASEDTVSSFNNGFSVIDDDAKNSVDPQISEVLSPEDEEELMQEKWDNGEFDDISEKIQEVLDEVGDDDPKEATETVQKYLTPVDGVPAPEKEKTVPYMLKESFEIDQLQRDMQTSLYLSAYEMKKDYENMLNKARELQASNIVGNQYTGIYYELKVGKYRNDENWQKKYRDRINFWMKKMLEDPTDYLSATYRIRSYIDIGDFENAEQLCSCMPTDMKESLMEEIQKAKEKGGGDDGNTSE